MKISRREVFSFAAGAAFLATGPAWAKASAGESGQIYLIRGLLNVFSTGLDGLHTELAKEGIKSQTTALSDPHGFATIIASDYRSSRSGRPVILVGHSLGADDAIHTAAELDKMGVPVALLVTLDAMTRGPVTANVRRAVNYYSGLGVSGPLKSAPGFKGKLLNVDVVNGRNAIKGVGHLDIDKNQELHRRVIREIKAVLHRH
jgi:hypothetical protein